MKRTAKASWTGDGLNGQGFLTTQSGVFNKQPYSFKTRFGSEDGRAGTNPEELIAAAHSGCFSMALSFMLTGAGYKVDSIETDADVELKNEGGKFSISGIHLKLRARIPEISEQKFKELSQDAKANCPVSKALASIPIQLTAELLK